MIKYNTITLKNKYKIINYYNFYITIETSFLVYIPRHDSVSQCTYSARQNTIEKRRIHPLAKKKTPSHSSNILSPNSSNMS